MWHRQQNFDEYTPVNTQSDDDNWLLSYIDVFTLLLALFVVLLAFSSPDAQEEKGSYPGPELIKPAEIKQHKKSASLAEPQTLEEPQISKKPQASQEQKLLQQYKKTLQSQTERGSVELSIGKSGVALQLGEKVLFESGETELLREGRRVLDVIIPSLRDSKYLINVQGHTDNQPIYSDEFPSNWELSAARASSVVRYLIRGGIPANRLSATGFADTISIADNNSEEGRARNRRVTLLIKLD